MRVVQVGSDLDFLLVPLGTHCSGQFRPENFDGNVSLMLQVLSEIDNGHATATKFTIYGIPVGKSSFQTIQVVGHGRLRCNFGRGNARVWSNCFLMKTPHRN